MIYTRNHKQGYIPGLDPFVEIMGKKRYQMLQDSWAALFRSDILPVLPVEKIKAHFSEDQGRPTKELYATMGAILLQQMHDLTDEETVEQFAFNMQWHYALDIIHSDDQHAYMCQRTLWAMRAMMSDLGLEEDLFQAVATKLAEVYDVDTSLQRMDSTHLCSNMKKLGRVSLFVTTIRGFLRNLKRHHQAAYDALDAALCDRYTRKQWEGAFASARPAECGRTLKEVSEDLRRLVAAFHDHAEISKMSSYKKMVRLFDEQCVVTNNEGDPVELTDASATVDAKPAKELTGDCMQNPSDPDAGYSGHKGTGFSAQIMETCTASPEEEGLSLITHAEVEPAHCHDSAALVPAIERSEANGLAPKQLLADSSYGSDANMQSAAEHGVDLVSPTMGGMDEGERVALHRFEMTEEKVVACPEERAPEHCKPGRNGGVIARFPTSVCGGCALRERCRVSKGRKGFYLRVSAKSVRLALRRRHEQTDAFRSLYAMRAGIEATNAMAKQKIGLGRLRVRGRRAVRFAVMLKLTAVNIYRANAFRIRQNAPKNPDGADNGSILAQIYAHITETGHRKAKFFAKFTTILKTVASIPTARIASVCA